MLVYLKPLSIFPELHSDTLFGAITHAISELYPDIIEDMIDSFCNQPPFILSSTFPVIINGEKIIRFYPKIIAKQYSNKTSIRFDTQDFKDFKKIKYIEEDLFFSMIKGELDESDIIQNFKSYYNIKKTLLMKEKIDLDVSFGENTIPNNSVNRISNETEGIFYTSGNEFKNMGLFFFIEFNDKKYIPIVKAALKFLRDRGFGKDISNGKGQFDYSIDEDYSINDIYNSSKNDYFITLSRFIPTEEDLNIIIDNSSYEIGSKRGKSSNGNVKKQFRFFKEGSVFKFNKDNHGKIFLSGKNPPSYEYGFAFPVKF